MSLRDSKPLVIHIDLPDKICRTKTWFFYIIILTNRGENVAG